MSSKRFPFFMRISPQQCTKEQKTHTAKPHSHPHSYISHTIYSSPSYPDEADYRVISSFYPSDTILLSSAKTIKGLTLNKKLITKDDLYQYHLNHKDDTQPLQFSFVFNELVSNSFIYQRLNIHSSSSCNKNANVFIYGRQRTSFALGILVELYNQLHNLSLTFYSFNYITKEKKMIKDTMKNIPIKNTNDIKSALKKMKNEYKLSKINLDSDIDTNNNTNGCNESFILSVSSANTTLNLFTMNITDYSNNNSNNTILNDAQTLLQCGYDNISSFILNITDQSIETTKLVSNFNYMYINQDSLIKLPLVKILISNKTSSSIMNTIPNNSTSSRNINNLLSPIAKTHPNDDLNDSMLFEEKPMTANIYQTPQHTVIALSEKELGLVEQEKKYTHNIDNNNEQDNVKQYQSKKDKEHNITPFDSVIDKSCNEDISKLLDAEKREKLSLMIEVKCLKKKLDLHQSSLLKKNDQIDQLIIDKSALEIENKELKEKNNQFYATYSKLNKKRECNFVDIEDKITQFESELNAFQKENASLMQINTKQAMEINSLKKEKEVLYSKYKSSKGQIEKLGNKLNQIEAEFIKLSAHFPKNNSNKRTNNSNQNYYRNNLLSINSSDDEYNIDTTTNNNDSVKYHTRSTRDGLIQDLRNKISKYHSINN